MPTTTSGMHIWLVAMAAALAARANIVTWDVLVTTGWVSDIDRRDTLILGDPIEGEQEWGLLGNLRRDERFTVGGTILVQRAGKGESVIQATRERAVNILAELEDELRVRPTVGATVKVAALTRYSIDQGADSDGRWCQLEFEVSNWRDLPS